MKIAEGIRLYIAFKQSSGGRHVATVKTLTRFEKRVGNIDLAAIEAKHVSSFLETINGSCRSRIAAFLRLEHLFEHWALRGRMVLFDMPLRPARVQVRLRSFVYSESQVRSLLHATEKCQESSNCRVDAETLKMFLTLLYATGATVYELLCLKRGNVDIRKRSLSVYNSRFQSSRQIPIGTDLRILLDTFLKRRMPACGQSDALFVDRGGRPIEAWQMTYSFSRLRTIAGFPIDRRYRSQPCLQDFRTTFAVHRMETWFRKGNNLNRMLPALAVYMGKADISSVDRYMDITPSYFAEQLVILGPRRPNYKEQRRRRAKPNL